MKIFIWALVHLSIMTKFHLRRHIYHGDNNKIPCIKVTCLCGFSCYHSIRPWAKIGVGQAPSDSAIYQYRSAIFSNPYPHPGLQVIKSSATYVDFNISGPSRASDARDLCVPTVLPSAALFIIRTHSRAVRWALYAHRRGFTHSVETGHALFETCRRLSSLKIKLNEATPKRCLIIDETTITTHTHDTAVALRRI